MNGMIRCSCLMFCNPPLPLSACSAKYPPDPLQLIWKVFFPLVFEWIFIHLFYSTAAESNGPFIYIRCAVSVLISRLGFTKILISFVSAGGITLPPRVIHK